MGIDGKFPAFRPLKDESVFKNARAEYGAAAWADGKIDAAPETMHETSLEYREMHFMQTITGHMRKIRIFRICPV